jgi:hypothetical protein
LGDLELVALRKIVPAQVTVVRVVALRGSASLTMLYRSNMLRVRWPDTAIAIVSRTPARTMFRTLVRRRSWNRRPATPAESQVVAQAFRKSTIGWPWRWKT